TVSETCVKVLACVGNTCASIQARNVADVTDLIPKKVHVATNQFQRGIYLAQAHSTKTAFQTNETVTTRQAAATIVIINLGFNLQYAFKTFGDFCTTRYADSAGVT